MNRTLEDMLRYFVSPHQTDWDQHISLAEFAINSYQESTKTTPFRLNIFKDPQTPLSLATGCNVPAAQSFADGMQHDIVLAKQHLQTAQQRQKKYADTGRRLAPFSIGDEQGASEASLETTESHFMLYFLASEAQSTISTP